MAQAQEKAKTALDQLGGEIDNGMYTDQEIGNMISWLKSVLNARRYPPDDRSDEELSAFEPEQCSLTVVYRSKSGPTALDQDLKMIAGDAHSSGFDLDAQERGMVWKVERDKVDTLKDRLSRFLSSNPDCTAYRIDVSEGF